MLLSYTLLSLFATTVIQTSSSEDWCESGMAQPFHGPWTDLPQDAVAPVAEKRLREAVEWLGERELVPLSRERANRLAGRKLAVTTGEVFMLARAGVVGGPGVTIHQYLRNRQGGVRFMGSVSRDGKKLLIVTGELTPRYPTRRFAVVVRTPPGVVTASSRCLWGG